MTNRCCWVVLLCIVALEVEKVKKRRRCRKLNWEHTEPGDLEEHEREQRNEEMKKRERM